MDITKMNKEQLAALVLSLAKEKDALQVAKEAAEKEAKEAKEKSQRKGKPSFKRSQAKNIQGKVVPHNYIGFDPGTGARTVYMPKSYWDKMFNDATIKELYLSSIIEMEKAERWPTQEEEALLKTAANEARKQEQAKWKAEQGSNTIVS
jgi:hypothetical protein